MKKVPKTSVAIQQMADIQDVVLRPARSWRLLLWQIIRFGIVGVINSAVDILALNILLLCFPTHNANTLLLYNSIAATLAAFNSYLMNKYWTFQRGRVVARGELLRFATLSVIAFLCNDSIVWIAAQILRPVIADPTLWANTSKLTAIGGSTIISYFGMNFWVFSSKSQEGVEKGRVYSMPATDVQEWRSPGDIEDTLDDDDPTQPRKAVGKFQ